MTRPLQRLSEEDSRRLDTSSENVDNLTRDLRQRANSGPWSGKCADLADHVCDIAERLSIERDALRNMMTIDGGERAAEMVRDIRTALLLEVAEECGRLEAKFPPIEPENPATPYLLDNRHDRQARAAMRIAFRTAKAAALALEPGDAGTAIEALVHRARSAEIRADQAHHALVKELLDHRHTLTNFAEAQAELEKRT